VWLPFYYQICGLCNNSPKPKREKIFYISSQIFRLIYNPSQHIFGVWKSVEYQWVAWTSKNVACMFSGPQTPEVTCLYEQKHPETRHPRPVCLRGIKWSLRSLASMRAMRLFLRARPVIKSDQIRGRSGVLVLLILLGNLNSAAFIVTSISNFGSMIGKPNDWKRLNATEALFIRGF